MLLVIQAGGRVINVCNSLSQDTVNFSKLNKFKSSLSLSDLSEFLGQLPKVDLIILEGGKMSVRPYVRPSTKSFFDLNEIWYIGRGR